MESWLSSGHNKIVVLQDRLASNVRACQLCNYDCLFTLEKAFNASALQWQLIYNTRRYAVQIWHLTRSDRTRPTPPATSKISTSIRCKNSSKTWSDPSRSHPINGIDNSGRSGKKIAFYHLPFLVHRYLEYFIGLLSGDIKLNSLPLYLRFIKMESPPCMHHKISYHENEWSSFIKIFEGERFVFISGRSRSILLSSGI